MHKKVTVLICNHNYKHFLKSAILSCVKQTYKPLQICIIDDGSSDGSHEFIYDFIFKDQKYEKIEAPNGITVYSLVKDNKYTYIQLKDNKGPSYARNVGIDITLQDTDLYAILDADDIMNNNKIEEMVNKFEENNNIGVVYADYDILNMNTGNVIREYKEPFSKRKLMQECIVHSGAMIKKEALIDAADKYGYYNILLRTCEDYDLWMRISEKYIISHIPKSLTVVRNHNNNSTYSVPIEVWQQNWSYIRQKYAS